MAPNSPHFYKVYMATTTPPTLSILRERARQKSSARRLHGQNEFEDTGFGLSKVRHIIDKHGGRDWAESVINQGTTVCFTR